MATFQDLHCSVTVRIRHDEDFTFPKIKEELALKLRADRLNRIRESWGVSDVFLSIDEDGDISVQSYKGTLVITQNAVILTEWLVPLKRVMDGTVFPQPESVLNEAFGARTLVQAVGYEVRLYLSLRFNEDLNHEKMVPSYLREITDGLCGNGPRADVNSNRWACEYVQDGFERRWEVRVERQEFQVRHSAGCKSAQVGSLKEFLARVRPPLANSITKIEALVEPYIASPEKLRGVPFAPPEQA
jgi:hypothetical protein